MAKYNLHLLRYGSIAWGTNFVLYPACIQIFNLMDYICWFLDCPHWSWIVICTSEPQIKPIELLKLFILVLWTIVFTTTIICVMLPGMILPPMHITENSITWITKKIIKCSAISLYISLIRQDINVIWWMSHMKI